MRHVAQLESLISTWDTLESRSSDLEELVSLAEESTDADELAEQEHDALAADIRSELDDLETEYQTLEVTLTLGGETTHETQYCRSTLVPEEPRLKIGPKCYSACTCAGAIRRA